MEVTAVLEVVEVEQFLAIRLLGRVVVVERLVEGGKVVTGKQAVPQVLEVHRVQIHPAIQAQQAVLAPSVAMELLDS
jgi:hypothetical protein